MRAQSRPLDFSVYTEMLCTEMLQGERSPPVCDSEEQGNQERKGK